MNPLQSTHDLSLPKWGPYTKKYMGISHIADDKKGLRFDLSVFPGLYRRKVDIPNVNWESGYHPWEASPDLAYYSNRHELEWKDQVYTDISFSEIDADSRLIRCECVNNTHLSQNIVMHYMAYMNFPPYHPYSVEGAGAVWVDAVEYSELKFAIPRPTDNLVPDGLFRGEVRRSGFVNGRGLGQDFGRDAGDTAIYRFCLHNPVEDGAIQFRYRLPRQGNASFRTEGILDTCIDLAGDGEFSTATFPLGALPKGEHYVKLISLGSSPIELDGFCITESSKVSTISYMPDPWNPHPQILEGPAHNAIILKYNNTDEYYGIAWLHEDYEVREFHCDELDRFMRHTVHNHVSKVLKGNGNGHFTNVFMRPIELGANSRKTVYGLVCSGGRSDVEERILSFLRNTGKAEEIYLSQKKKAFAFPAITEGGDISSASG